VSLSEGRAQGTSTQAGDVRPGSRGTLNRYQRLARVVHSLVGEQSEDAVLERVANDLRQLVPCTDVVLWELAADDTLVPTLIDGEDQEAMRRLRIRVGEGITGRAVLDQEAIASSDAHIDPRAALVPGTLPEPEAILCVPLTARARRLGALTLYRRGRNRAFSNDELELARQFADVAAIALHNANTLAEFQRLAMTDDLTGLANRRGFREELERLAASAGRHAIPLSILLLDVDDFKKVNDAHGHATGDEILREIALMLRQRIRASDLAARIGGDEFAVLLPHTSEDEAAVVASDLIAHLQEGRATSLPLRVSVGVASGTEALDEALFAQADRALYAAKGLTRSSKNPAQPS
jgi:diguanylate cyclase (GGDEF)-like protein